MTQAIDEIWWSACVGCGLWGLIIGVVLTSMVALVGRAWRRERKGGGGAGDRRN